MVQPSLKYVVDLVVPEAAAISNSSEKPRRTGCHDRPGSQNNSSPGLASLAETARHLGVSTSGISKALSRAAKCVHWVNIVPQHPMPRESRALRPDVIVDFIFEDGLFFIGVENIGDRPALKVSIRFDPPITGVEGSLDLAALPLFRHIEFLAPHKTIRTFLDTSTAYFHRGEPTQIRVSIAYQDANRKRYRATIQHDLGIYRDIGYVRRQAPPGSPPSAE